MSGAIVIDRAARMQHFRYRDGLMDDRRKLHATCIHACSVMPIRYPMSDTERR